MAIANLNRARLGTFPNDRFLGVMIWGACGGRPSVNGGGRMQGRGGVGEVGGAAYWSKTFVHVSWQQPGEILAVGTGLGLTCIHKGWQRWRLGDRVGDPAATGHRELFLSLGHSKYDNTQLVGAQAHNRTGC